jgi:hypothetical protein
VDQPAGDMKGEEAQRPEDEQDDCDGQKHGQNLSGCGTGA